MKKVLLKIDKLAEEIPLAKDYLQSLMNRELWLRKFF